MASGNADSIGAISADDLQQHILRYGLDVLPAVDVRAEIVKAHDLFQVLQGRWPEFYQELSFRPQSAEFNILTTYEVGGTRAKLPTFGLAARGPVFRFPRRLAVLGEVNQDKDLDATLFESLNVLRHHFPGLQIFRLGLVRELVFGTGKTNSVSYVSSRVGAFPGAELHGGDILAAFRDDRCNIRVKVKTIRIQRQTGTPAVRVLSDEPEYGLMVEFDVNNIDMRPQSDSDLALTLERAHSLWPDELLRFINWSEP